MTDDGFLADHPALDRWAMSCGSTCRMLDMAWTIVTILGVARLAGTGLLSAAAADRGRAVDRKRLLCGLAVLVAAHGWATLTAISQLPGDLDYYDDNNSSTSGPLRPRSFWPLGRVLFHALLTVLVARRWWHQDAPLAYFDLVADRRLLTRPAAAAAADIDALVVVGDDSAAITTAATMTSDEALLAHDQANRDDEDGAIAWHCWTRVAVTLVSLVGLHVALVALYFSGFAIQDFRAASDCLVVIATLVVVGESRALVDRNLHWLPGVWGADTVLLVL